MHKLHDIFLRKFLVLFLILFLTLGLIIYFWIRHIYIEQTKHNLLDNINIISLSVTSLSHLDEKAKILRDTSNLRITFINGDGEILGESDKDLNSMDNHANREEVIAAKNYGFGYSIRKSDTLNKELLYVAKKFLLQEQEYYIRLSADIEKISREFIYLSIKIGFLFLIFIVIAFVVAIRINTNIQSQINNIVLYLLKIKKHQKINTAIPPYSYEFSQILDLLKDVANSLAKKEKQKTKYTAKLKLANKQKDEIISAISHEFKNPIAVINGYSQTLLEDKGLNSEIQEKFLKKIVSNSLKLAHLIDRIRLSLKLEEGNYEENFHKVNIVSLCSSVIEDLKITYPNRTITIEAPQEVFLSVDETMLKIAVENLIENALKYSQERVNVIISPYKISVVDLGIGISEDDLQKITQRFYRASKNGWNNSLGIGLSIVQSIMKMHKFTLHIESEENKGSTFSIIFKKKIDKDF